jgi:hypothetical protein
MARRLPRRRLGDQERLRQTSARSSGLSRRLQMAAGDKTVESML